MTIVSPKAKHNLQQQVNNLLRYVFCTQQQSGPTINRQHIPHDNIKLVVRTILYITNESQVQINPQKTMIILNNFINSGAKEGFTFYSKKKM